MPSRRKKRRSATKRFQRRLYQGAALATFIYVALSVVRFHGQFSYLPYILAVIWAVFLLCYTTLKEVFRWNDSEQKEIYRGEAWAVIVLAGAGWMIIWNIAQSWIFHRPVIKFPEDYEAAVVETIVLYTLSIISSFLHKRKKVRDRLERRRARSARRRVRIPASAQQEPVVIPTDNQGVGVILTKAESRKDDSPKSG